MRKLFIAAGLAAAFMVPPATASAQVSITPFAGVAFEGDTAGEQLSGGASLLLMGKIVGVELEFGYTPDFYNESSEIELVGDSNVTSLSANLLLGWGAGPVRPYVTGGLGLLRTRIDSAEQLFDDVSSNDLGLNAGGGLMVFFNDHVGLRGDLRYFRGFSEIDIDDLEVTLDGFDFWRAYGGVTIGF